MRESGLRREAPRWRLITPALAALALLLPLCCAGEAQVGALECLAVGRDGAAATTLDCQQSCSGAGDAGESCSPEDCACVLPFGETRASLEKGSAKCFVFDVFDKHHFLKLGIEAGVSTVFGLVTTGTGPEEPPRFAWEDVVNGSYPSYRVAPGEPLSLSRTEWRRTAGSDEGEWEGRWSLCLNGGAPDNETAVDVALKAAKCAFGAGERVCSGEASGSCVQEEKACVQGVAPTCFQYECQCKEGFRGEACETDLSGSSEGDATADDGGATEASPSPANSTEEGGGGPSAGSPTGGASAGGNDVKESSKHDKPETGLPGNEVRRKGSRGHQASGEEPPAAFWHRFFLGCLGLGIVAAAVGFLLKTQLAREGETLYTLLDLNGKKKGKRSSKRRLREIQL